jgi:hypothetical protein
MFKKSKKEEEEALESLRQRIESQVNIKENPDKAKGKPAKQFKQESAKPEPPAKKVETAPPAVSRLNDDLEKELEFEEMRNRHERDNKIPGYGWLFGIDEKFLPESTVLDRGEVLSFALGNMQENMLNPHRTESLFALFAKDVMRMNISVKGLAREQALMARQQDADRGATLNNLRDLTGRPGAL